MVTMGGTQSLEPPRILGGITLKNILDNNCKNKILIHYILHYLQLWRPGLLQ